MSTIGSVSLDMELRHGYDSGGSTDDNHLQRGGAGLTDAELAQLAIREVLLILDDAAACVAAQTPRASSLGAFLSYMRREGYARSANPVFDPAAEAARGAAPWRNQPGTENTRCEPPGEDGEPTTSCDGGGTRKVVR